MVMLGCVDPFSKFIRDNQYQPIIPVSSGHYVGSIYPKDDLSTAPIILLPDVFDKEEADKLMEELKGPASLKSIESEKTYSIGADVAIIGYVSAALKNSGVKKFKVRVEGAEQYIISQARFTKLLNNDYKKFLKDSSLDGAYYVYGLLKVSSLEYELYSDNEAKLSIATLSKIENEIKGKLGAEWKINDKGNLGFNEPRFIGFRAEKIRVNPNPIVHQNEALDISRIYLIDESQAKSTDGEAAAGFDRLIRRNNSQFVFEKPEQLKVALVFEVDGFKVEDYKVNLEGCISIVSAGSNTVAKAPLQSVFSVDDWEKKPLIRSTGVQKVKEFFGYGNDYAGKKIPYVALLEDFQKTEAPDGDIDIVISIKDGLSKQEKSKKISVQFRQR